MLVTQRVIKKYPKQFDGLVKDEYKNYYTTTTYDNGNMVGF